MTEAKETQSRNEYYLVANKDRDDKYYVLNGEPYVTQCEAHDAAMKSISDIKDWRNSYDPASDPVFGIPNQMRRVLKVVVVEQIDEALL